MKKLLATLAFLALLLNACTHDQSEERSLSTDPVEPPDPAVNETLEMVTDGDFTFVYRSEDGNTVVDILYKNQSVGEFFKEGTKFSYTAVVLKQNATYAYLLLKPKNETPAPTVSESLARLTLDTLDLRFLTYSGTALALSDDDRYLVCRMEFGDFAVMDLSQALYPNGKNVQIFSSDETQTVNDQFSVDLGNNL